jgi:hypothetical protein
VRVKARKGKRKKGGNGQLVIVSRKLLDELRPTRNRSLLTPAPPAPVRAFAPTAPNATARRDKRRTRKAS